MCTYIAAILPEGTDQKAAIELFKKHNLGFSLQHDRPPAIGKADLFVLTNTKNCDCGTVLGRGYVHTPNLREPESEIPKLQKKGWSQAKINRWLEDKSRRPDPIGTEREEELERWMTTIKEILNSGVTSRLGLFVHFYNERFNSNIIKHVEQIRLDHLTPEILLQLADDTLYEFTLPPVVRKR